MASNGAAADAFTPCAGQFNLWELNQHDDDYYSDLLLLRSAGVRDGQTGHHYGAGPELCKWARRTRKGMLLQVCFAFLKGVENRPMVLDSFSARYDNHCQFVHLITII
jgi:hypothetical protein